MDFTIYIKFMVSELTLIVSVRKIRLRKATAADLEMKDVISPRCKEVYVYRFIDIKYFILNLTLRFKKSEHIYLK